MSELPRSGASAESPFGRPNNFDGNTSGIDYLYDANGNMTEDKNKGLDSIQYNFMNLPVKVVKSDSTYQKYTYSAAGAKLVVESYNNSDSLLAKTDYLGAFVYENDVLRSIEHSEGRIIPGVTAGTWEHQYHIKDHQGNNRLTFTTDPNTFEYLATMETARATEEEGYFSNIDETGMSVPTYVNHTPTSVVPSPSRAIRINNANDNPQKVIGAAIPLQVFPGDVVSAEVFAKYQNYVSTNDDAIGAMAAFMESAFGLPTVNGETQDIFDFMEGAPFLGLAAWNDVDDTVPRAFLNYIIMDKNFNFVDFGFEQVSGAAEIPGTNPGSHSHEQLSFNLPITEEGYIYLYVSNESQNNADVYFDDFKVTHVESKVVQTNDFYPFGLAAESFSRLSNIPNKFLYNSGAELNEISGNYETFYRHYDPVLGRFNSIDPLASSFTSLTPYQYANNDPVLFNDPLGDRFAREHEFLPSAVPYETYFSRGAGGANPFVGRQSTKIIGDPFLDAMSAQMDREQAAFLSDGNSEKSDFELRRDARAGDKYAAQEYAKRHGTSVNFTVSTEEKENNIWIPDGQGGNQLFLGPVTTNLVITVTGKDEGVGGLDQNLRHFEFEGSDYADVLLPAAEGVVGVADLAVASAAQGAKGAALSGARVAGNTLAAVGGALAIGVATYEYGAGKFNTHSIANLVFTGTALVAGGLAAAAGAPVIVLGIGIVGLGYGIYMEASGNDALNEWSQNWGRNLVYGNP